MFAAELDGLIAAPRETAWGAVLAAPFVGSFLGVLIRRLPEARSVVWARSQCEACGAVLKPRDLVPLLSWLALRGRCRFCRLRLSRFYPAIELAAVAVALVAIACDSGAMAWLDCLLGWWLLTLAWIDVRHWLLPDALTLPLILAGLVAAFIFDPARLLDRTLGAVVGYLTLRVIAFVYCAVRGRDGLGEGDAKLLAASGAWVGISGLPQLVLIAALAGLLAAACLRRAGFPIGRQSAIPFGPFLALATWIVWLLPALSG
jgi:leader peptidase (prepilin peptidase) / N-methyltransferase